MAIIEFAHITLMPPITASDPLLRQNMREVKRVIEDYSKLQTLFTVQLNDPSVMYVVGAWETKEKHMNGFDGSPQQAGILELIKDQMGIDWMHYLDVEQKKIAMDAKVLAVVKLNFDRGKINREEVGKELAALSASDSSTIVQAWNLHKDETEDDVLVQFSGWNSKEDASEHTKRVEQNEGLKQKAKAVDIFYTTQDDLR